MSGEVQGSMQCSRPLERLRSTRTYLRLRSRISCPCGARWAAQRRCSLIWKLRVL